MDEDYVRSIVREEMRAVGEAQFNAASAFERRVADTQRVVVLPGEGRSHYLYAFLLDRELNTTSRVRIKKEDFRNLLLRAVQSGDVESASPGSVELHGSFLLRTRAKERPR
jgi:hypothetical protein